MNTKDIRTSTDPDLAGSYAAMERAARAAQDLAIKTNTGIVVAVDGKNVELTAADLIKMSMVKVQQAIDEQQRQTKVIMQVHDELVFEVPESEVEWVRTEVPRLMAEVAQLKVPLLAEVGVGANWDEAH